MRDLQTTPVLILPNKHTPRTLGPSIPKHLAAAKSRPSIPALSWEKRTKYKRLPLQAYALYTHTPFSLPFAPDSRLPFGFSVQDRYVPRLAHKFIQLYSLELKPVVGFNSHSTGVSINSASRGRQKRHDATHQNTHTLAGTGQSGTLQRTRANTVTTP